MGQKLRYRICLFRPGIRYEPRTRANSILDNTHSHGMMEGKNATDYVHPTHTIQDSFNRPIASAPDAWIDVIERYSNENNKTLFETGKINRCLNLASYNYLGFASTDECCTPQVINSLNKFSPSTCSSRVDGGTTVLHNELETLIASFVGKPAALVYGMGFATNSTTLPALIGKGGLIISDSLNHKSIAVGARASRSKKVVFKHNSPSHLEDVLRKAIARGQSRTHRPWKKIIIVVEGIYSMEGDLCKLPEIVKVCKKYKAYIYLDEAHSIGVVGKSGRGICELLGVDPADIDVMMGTFTKSFGACGGYIAGSKDLIKYLKSVSPGHLYATSMTPPGVQQVISALKVVPGEDGSNRGLQKMGCQVYGDLDSPVIPIILYNPAKIPAFSRECFKRNIAVVTVGFPATGFLPSRARICISASHTKDDLLRALEVISEVGDMVHIKYFPTESEKQQKRE